MHLCCVHVHVQVDNKGDICGSDQLWKVFDGASCSHKEDHYEFDERRVNEVDVRQIHGKIVWKGQLHQQKTTALTHQLEQVESNEYTNYKTCLRTPCPLQNSRIKANKAH